MVDFIFVMEFYSVVLIKGLTICYSVIDSVVVVPGDTLNELLLILIQTHSKSRPVISTVHLHLVHLHF